MSSIVLQSPTSRGTTVGGGVVLRGGQAVGWVDPLAELNALLALRLHTHRGDNLPLGLYIDEAGTMPAAEWDAVACWSDELSLSGLRATQSDPDKRPLLVFVDGVPLLMPDGVDDVLNLSASIVVTTTLTCFLGAQLNNVAGARSVLSPTASSGGPWFHMREGKGNLYNDNVAALPTSMNAVANDQIFVAAMRLRTDGLDYFLDGAGNGSTGDTTTFTSPITDLFSYKGTQPLSGFVCSLVIATSALSDPDVAIINGYLGTLFYTP